MSERSPVSPLFRIGLVLLLATLTELGVANSAAAAAPGPASVAPPTRPAGPPVGDVRISLVELMLQERFPAALALTEQALAMSVDRRPPGLQYLHAHLLEKEGRQQEAADAFGAAMTALPVLRPYARYRLALGQARLGHPEVAAGLLATMLGDHPPAVLTAPALRLLRGAIGAGGDCRVLRGIDTHGFAEPERRQLELATADCEWRGTQRPAASARWNALLEANVLDDAAREAAERLAELPANERNQRCDILIGLALNAHREFERSNRFLEPALAALDKDPAKTPRLSGAEDSAARYALARNEFWLGHYAVAADRFTVLARRNPGSDEQAQALYQLGRAHEMVADWHAAASDFRQAYLAKPVGEYAPSALYAALRVEWIAGNEGEALKLNNVLGQNRRWRLNAGRAGLFFAVSDIVRGRADRAPAWLAQADRSGAPAGEVAYWRGRLFEIAGKPEAAAAAYADSLQREGYGLLADRARLRLKSSTLAPAARALGERLSMSPDSGDLWRAWLLLGDDSQRGAAARLALGNALARDPAARTYLYLAPRPPASWPMWQANLRDPEEILLALGLWSEGAPAVSRYFSVSDPGLALAGAQLLTRAGEIRRTLYVAEILHRNLPSRLPEQLLPAEFRQILYPLPWRVTLEAEARRRGIESAFLAGIVREESRFDPRAVSGASARGLAQFVLPTARAVGSKIGLSDLTTADLERPEISLALGAAYLADLERQLGGPVQAAAAYNAGEVQAQLWRAYCTGPDPEEYLSKVSFRETRGYIEEVLTSAAQYRELYPSH
ncbi:MAG: lytic transglycosylase domain-containing protein [Acidobacteriota bacterium]